ncbi:MAG: RNA polymerase subunit sigma-70 [Gallintestinimicrobium sp.]
MTHQQKEQITALRSQGYGYATIAKAIGLKKDTVVAFCRKVGLTGTKAADNSRIELDAGFCPQCGALLTQTPGRKRVKFCSDNCRTAWWNAHPEKVNRKASIPLYLRSLRKALHRLRQYKKKILLSRLLYCRPLQRR